MLVSFFDIRMDLLLGVWRAACRQLELGEAIGDIAVLIREHAPIDLVFVRHIRREEARVETVAAARSDGGPVSHAVRTQCSPAEIRSIVEWCGSGTVLRARIAEDDGPVRRLVPAGVEGHALAAPLLSTNGADGVLVLTGRPAGGFDGEHERILESLLEPFSVALENDRRFHELARLRESAEADRRALLSRLHRQHIVESIVGAEGTLRGVMERVNQVARAQAPVLILGETGSGKEVVARAIHARSARRDGPIVRVNCGAIPSELVDSELFGHERGSFTGAVSTHHGWFERADGGTLFLDEIGELPLAAQVRLLRVLQDGSFERVGGRHTLTADVRILAATNRDLESLVATGSFREDLWYRISVFPIHIPPLRSRREDIPVLANHFAHNAGLRLGNAPLVPSESDLNLLIGYPWPGNVRELAAVIERAAILGNGHRLDIMGAMGTKLHAVESRPDDTTTPGAPPTFLRLDDAMARHIEQALRATRGRIEGPHGAARLLGINPHTLRGRMRRLAIDWRSFRAG